MEQERFKVPNWSPSTNERRKTTEAIVEKVVIGIFLRLIVLLSNAVRSPRAGVPLLVRA